MKFTKYKNKHKNKSRNHRNNIKREDHKDTENGENVAASNTSTTYNNGNKTVSNPLCDRKMTFQECELTILRAAVDSVENIQGKKTAALPEIKAIMHIVEVFLKQKHLICYGGTAINNILPKQDQFYNKEIDIPDYDFFSADALNDAKELTNIYFKAGFEEVEAKSGQHHGTYKVFVNFIPVADITSIPTELFNKLKTDAKRVGGILYAPPNYLRMSMYLELSRPAGDVSRWEKVLKRLVVLNKHYPLVSQHCDTVEFQRKMSSKLNDDAIYNTVKQALIDQSVIFFGGFAVSLMSHYMPRHMRTKLEKNPDFDVLSEEPTLTAEIVKERLEEIGIKNVSIHRLEGIGEIIAPHYEIKVGKDNVAVIYEPLACHSYNTITQHGEDINIASIDTMLSFYLAFLYIDNPLYNYNPDRILCMSQFLFEVQKRNRLKQKGLLKRFSINCIGHQETIEEMRAQKTAKFQELKNNRNSKEFEEWFLRYRPADLAINKKVTDNDKERGKASDEKSSEPKNVTVKQKPKRKKTGTRKKPLSKLLNIFK
jgi:hypothetical protein